MIHLGFLILLVIVFYIVNKEIGFTVNKKVFSTFVQQNISCMKYHRYGYQGQFSEAGTTTGWNNFDLRMYDARFGRWISPDPYGQYASPYLAMGNNPVSGVDPDGGYGICTSCLSQFFSTLPTILESVTVTASRISASAVISGVSSALISGGYALEIGRYQNIEIPGAAEYTRNYQPREYPATGLSNIPSPQISFDAEISVLPPAVQPRGGPLGEVVRQGRAPIGNALTQILLTGVLPELAFAKLTAIAPLVFRAAKEGGIQFF